MRNGVPIKVSVHYLTEVHTKQPALRPRQAAQASLLPLLLPGFAMRFATSLARVRHAREQQ